MSGRQIIAFAKDYGADPTSCNHVLTEMSKDNTVIWLNSISARTPNLSSGKDLNRIWLKFKALFRGPTHVIDGLWVITPLVLPSLNRPLLVKLNRVLLKLGVGMVARRLRLRKPELWTWVPTSAHYIDAFDSSLVVYYCTDEWSKFTGIDGAGTERLMENLARRADLVFATSQPLVEKLAGYNEEASLASHGVDYELFATALGDLDVPADLADVEGPVIGYYGLVEDWLDLDLIAYLARRHPEWTIALVGKVCVDVSILTTLPNVRLLGQKPHAQLPAYCRRFDVGMIPHKVNDLTRHMNPIKLREYLAAGLPVVSTALPEVKRCSDLCGVASSYEEFEKMVVGAVENDSAAARRRRSEQMKEETWTSVTNRLVSRVMVSKNRQKSVCN